MYIEYRPCPHHAGPFENSVFILIRITCFPCTVRNNNWSFWISVTHHYWDVIIFENVRFQNVFRPHQNARPAVTNSSGLNSVLRKLPFRDGLVKTVGLTVKIKLFKFLRRSVNRA